MSQKSKLKKTSELEKNYALFMNFLIVIMISVLCGHSIYMHNIYMNNSSFGLWIGFILTSIVSIIIYILIFDPESMIKYWKKYYDSNNS